MHYHPGMRRWMLIGLIALAGCTLRRTARNAPFVDDATAETLIRSGMSPPGVLVGSSSSSGPMCAEDDSDPAHTCPEKVPDPR
jgi:hypothetical protein